MKRFIGAGFELVVAAAFLVVAMQLIRDAADFWQLPTFAAGISATLCTEGAVILGGGLTLYVLRKALVVRLFLLRQEGWGHKVSRLSSAAGAALATLGVICLVVDVATLLATTPYPPQALTSALTTASLTLVLTAWLLTRVGSPATLRRLYRYFELGPTC